MNGAAAEAVERAARSALATGDYTAACQPLEVFLETHAERYDLRCLLGFVHQHFGHLDAARYCYEVAQAIAPPSRELQQNLAQIYFTQGDLPRARTAFEAALRLAPNDLVLLDALAATLQAEGDLPGALGCYERILAIDPRHARAYVGMADAFSGRGWEEDAERSLRTALDFDADCVTALSSLAMVDLRAGRYEEAHALLDRAIRLSPQEGGLWRNKGLICAAQGDHAAAEQLALKALELDPQDCDSRFSLACTYLLTGRLREGWRDYEFRWASREGGGQVKAPVTRLPRWSGEPLVRETSALIIYPEQGFGDSIQFARYVPLAAQRFARVRLVTRPPLLGLFKRSFGALAEVVAESADESGFTHHCPVMSLPLAFDTTLDTIPAAVPYLTPDPAQAAAWAARLGALPGLKVGVAWATGKKGVHKASFELPLRRLAAIFALPGLSCISLNKEALGDDEQAFLRHSGVHDWTTELSDFDVTAALIAGLDLVLSVDTAVAHLAGALDRPVFLLNRAESEWRWLLGREDSPWYPSLRIFRQRSVRQWGAPLDAVCQALEQRLAGLGQ